MERQLGWWLSDMQSGGFFDMFLSQLSTYLTLLLPKNRKELFNLVNKL